MEQWQEIASLFNLSAVPLAGLVTYGVIAIFRGQWTPERVTKQLAEDRDKWYQAYELERTAHSVTRGNLTKVVDSGRTTVRVLDSITESDEG